MQIQDAIAKLSNALAAISQPEYDKEVVRSLKEIVDEKHWHYIEQGLQTRNKTLIIHGIMGAMSHYEAEKDKLHTLTKDT